MLILCTFLAWNGIFDPAYMPQQMALTAGFMCIIACDCNHKQLPASSLKEFSIDQAHAQFARDTICELIPWGDIDFMNKEKYQRRFDKCRHGSESKIKIKF